MQYMDMCNVFELIFQSCDLKFAPSEDCGLLPIENYTSWSQYTEIVKSLPSCTTGDAQGKSLNLLTNVSGPMVRHNCRGMTTSTHPSLVISSFSFFLRKKTETAF